MTDHDKKISGVEAPMNPVQQQSAPSEGRRRLMKGALAAPAVMTLMHGRLAAAMSATCAERNMFGTILGTTTKDGYTYTFTIDNYGNITATKDDGNTTKTYDATYGEAASVLGDKMATSASGSCWGSFA